MSKTKAQKLEAASLLKSHLFNCRSDAKVPQTILIVASNWHPTSTGLGCRLDVHIVGCGRWGNPETTRHVTVNGWLNSLIADALGYRQAKDQSLVSGGYGYSRSEQLASSLARLAGHEVFVQTIGESMGANGWFRPDAKYQLEAVSDRTGEVTTLSLSPLTHEQACEMKSRFTVCPGRTVRMVEVPS